MQTTLAILGILGTVTLGVAGVLASFGEKPPALRLLYAGLFFYASMLVLLLVNAIRKNETLPESIVPKSELPSKSAVSEPTRSSAPEPTRELPKRNKRDEYEPSEGDRIILWYLFQSNVDRDLGSIVSALRFQYSEEAVHRLENLGNHGYVRIPPRWSATDLFPEYRLTPKGREYVVKNLLQSNGDI